MTRRDNWRSGHVTQPTERKRNYVQPYRSGQSGDVPKPDTILKVPEERLEIREVRGRLQVVECK
jgi:hypothetical protein